MIEVSVKGANAVCTNPLPLTTGMNGVKVKFNFSRGWDNLTPLAVFTNGRTTLDAIITDDIATIPHEVLALKNRMVLVGVFGVDSSNNIIIPTIYAELGYVSLGADPTGDESAVTSPALYEQAIEKAENALDISREAAEDATTALEYAAEVKQKADAGELDGFSPSASVTKAGNKSTITITDKDGTTTAEVTDGRTPVKGTDYFTSDDIAAVRAGLENSVNKTTVLSSASTDSQYPSAKAVRDYVQSQMTRLSGKMDHPNNDGTPGQVLKKTEDGTEWADESGGGQSIDASLLDTAVTKSSVATWENGVAKIGDGTITVTVIDAAGKKKVVVDHDDNPDEYCDTTYVREDFSAARVPGKKVSHWTCDGEIISVNNPDLSLSIVEDCTVEAHYIYESEENTLEETGHTYCFLRPRYRQSNNTKYCLASNGAMVPAGATSAVYGCMRTFDQGYSTEDTLILENVGTLIAKTSTSIADGVTRKYGLTRISLPSEAALENIWVRPYTTYTLNGAAHTVYGPIKHISWNETMPDVVTEIEINGHKATIGGGGGASTDQDITMTDFDGTLREAFQYASDAMQEMHQGLQALLDATGDAISDVYDSIGNLGIAIDDVDVKCNSKLTAPTLSDYDTYGYSASGWKKIEAGGDFTKIYDATLTEAVSAFTVSNVSAYKEFVFTILNVNGAAIFSQQSAINIKAGNCMMTTAPIAATAVAPGAYRFFGAQGYLKVTDDTVMLQSVAGNMGNGYSTAMQGSGGYGPGAVDSLQFSVRGSGQVLSVGTRIIIHAR